MTKLGIILHSLGALASIGGIIGLIGHGWVVWQWPLCTLLWILSSAMNGATVARLQREQTMDSKQISDLHYEISKLKAELFQAQFGNAKK